MNNIDRSEIEKFSRLAAHWWDLDGDLKTLHDINPLRLNYIQQKCPLQGKSVLDVGCGGGILAESMVNQGAEVTAIDMSEDALTAARTHQLNSNRKVRYVLSTVENLDGGAQYDVITCLELLEHVPDPQSIVAACARLLKPKGSLFFSTINRGLKSYLFAIVGAEYILKMLPKNTHDFAKFIRPSELAFLARKSNLHVSDVIGMAYNPFTKKYKLNEDIAVNYIMHLIRE